MDRRIEAAIKIVQVERHRNMPIRELARRVNLSLWHFTRLFRSETSISPKQYIRDYKLRLAAQLLSESFLSVKEVAATVGFGDRSHFSRDFKRVHGQAPSAARGHRGTTSS
jgi:transcriptional regulator GlxA family with amidase domain